MFYLYRNLSSVAFGFKVDILSVVGVAIQSTLCAVEQNLTHISFIGLETEIQLYLYLFRDYPLLLVIGACGKSCAC